jgi:hypothetical protein
MMVFIHQAANGKKLPLLMESFTTSKPKHHTGFTKACCYCTSLHETVKLLKTRFGPFNYCLSFYPSIPLPIQFQWIWFKFSALLLVWVDFQVGKQNDCNWFP